MTRSPRFALAVLVPLLVAGCAGGPATSRISPAADGTLRMAEATRQGGDLGAAAELYQKVLKKDPANESARIGLAEVQLMAGETERARRSYGEAVSRNPACLEGVLGLAHIAVKKRELDSAENLFVRAQSLAAATDVRPLYGQAVTYDLRHRPEEAQKLYRRALAIQPDNVAVRSNLGLSLALSGDPHQAVNVLLDIATATSAPPQARQNLALAYGLLGNQEAAEIVLAEDMENTAVQNNLRYYDYLRTSQAATEPSVQARELP